MQKENELKETKERLEQHEKVVADLDRQYAQAMEEKNILAEQLQAETELCAEAEEMRARYITTFWVKFREIVSSSDLSFAGSAAWLVIVSENNACLIWQCPIYYF